MRTILLFCLSALSAGLSSAQEPAVQAHGPFSYPPILRAVNYSGDAVVRFVIAQDGSVTAAAGVSGQPVALRAAIEQVKTWHYKSGAAGEHQVTFHFHLEPRADEDDSSVVANETTFTPGLVDVMSTAPDRVRRDGCPAGTQRLAPQNQAATDWVETGGPGLRVMRDGAVLWDPPGTGEAVDWSLATHARIEPEQARELIEQFRTAAFWRLCKSYSSGATDTSTSYVRVSLGGVLREVNVQGEPAPPVFDALLNAIHEATNSHQWRVGDPKEEQMGDMPADAWLPKPARSQMMADAYRGKRHAVEAALLAGAAINAADDSGWTPLMYAAFGYSEGEGSVIQLLLEKGADVRAHGLHGETALHFAALKGDADANLLAAGADVNAATATGATPLMLLAQRADAGELKVLLDAGAKATAKDAEGRTALDYLQAANCNRYIVTSDTHPFMTLFSGSCRQLEKESFEAASALLQRAGAIAQKQWMPASE